MGRVEFELAKNEAEQFGHILDSKIPVSLKSENCHYSNAEYGIDFSHTTFQDKERIAGTYSYEKSPGGIYVCTLDLRNVQGVELGIPGKTIKPNTLEFSINELKYLTKHNSKAFKERGFVLYDTTGRHYQTFSFAHQAIAKDEKFVLRYDQERDDGRYVCHLNFDMPALEKISDLFQDWVQELISQNSSEQKIPHHASPQSACEPAKPT